MAGFYVTQCKITLPLEGISVSWGILWILKQ